MRMQLISDWSSIDMDDYVKKYNDSFRLGFTAETYRGYYSPQIWEKPPKILLVSDDSGEYISGAVLTYRILEMGGERRWVSVMGGAWTPEAYRGRGFMRKMIAFTVKENEERSGIHYMCGFGLMDNVSARFERGAGAYMHPAWYASGGEIQSGVPLVEAEELLHAPDEIYAGLKSSMEYSKAQFEHKYELNSPGAKILKIGNNYAVAVGTHSSEKITVMTWGSDEELRTNLNSLISWARKPGRKPLFLYTTNARESEIFRGFGFSMKDGYFSVLPSDERYGYSGDLNILMGDRE